MKSLLFALPVIALSTTAMAESAGMPPYTLDPGPHAGNWEATLAGTGFSNDDLDRNIMNVTGSIGYYFSKNVLLSFRQRLIYSDPGDNSLFNGASIFQAAYQWDLAKWQPYVGVNAGGAYGSQITDDGIFGVEGGLKYYVNESTFVFGNIAYETSIIQDCCSDGVFPYSLGIGFNF
ncbi:MAG: hypothetical protein ACREVK_13455 [Gammaproteobacteria bacterium]